MSPPRPPLPPSGPPSGLNFSRWTDAQPLPPSPAATGKVTRSTKVVMSAGLPRVVGGEVGGGGERSGERRSARGSPQPLAQTARRRNERLLRSGLARHDV